MATLTPNYGLSMPDATDNYSDFRESYNENMEIIDENMGGGGGSGSANQNIAENYDDTLTYSVGDYVIYNGLLYKSDTAVATAETFDPTKWTHVVVTDEMGSGGGSGGHTIYDENGSAMTQQAGLEFTGSVNVTDDSVNGRTVVDILGGGENVYGAFIDPNRIIKSATTITGNTTVTYTATEDCYVCITVISDYDKASEVKIDNIRVWRNYNGSSGQQANALNVYLRKSQVITITNGSTSYNGSYTVYGLLQGTNGIFAPVIYSDTERNIGVWKDGKPLYQKSYLISATAISANTWFAISAVDVTNFETIVKTELHLGGGENSNNGWGFGRNDNGVFKVFTPVQLLVNIITLQYTKTTDTAGSGDWNTDGVPTVHYSTSEQVIGTWIDGKPLYQKTWDFGQDITVGAWTSVMSVADVNIDILVSSISTQQGKTVSMIEYWVDGTTLKGNTLRPNTAVDYVRYLTLQYTKTTD